MCRSLLLLSYIPDLCQSAVPPSLFSLCCWLLGTKRDINTWPYLHFLFYISSIYFSLILLRIQSQFSKCVVSLPSIFSTSALLLSASSTTSSIFSNNLHRGAVFLFCSNLFFKKEKPMQLRMDSLCFCSSDAGCTRTSLSHQAEVYSAPPVTLQEESPGHLAMTGRVLF